MKLTFRPFRMLWALSCMILAVSWFGAWAIVPMLLIQFDIELKKGYPNV